ncbi:hypothetical protein Bhyg_04589 [Pseudolycoriella hygida]|uniref:Chitin-binding type-2 domain-containing protein n=1 Tax=Pseudolycoriella hygida TaxID=35572 RepID=A0A9Q0SA59_9DIPT|nr:hypothetical protein Bhyg_04589 [Pseudolycoriella hygida]
MSCPAIATTLSNRIPFDLKQPLKVESRAIGTEYCDNQWNGCSMDCSSLLMCDGSYSYIPVNVTSCNPSKPYCVKDPINSSSSCTGNFPINRQECLTRALDNFICTGNGQFPDPTDCTKYHVCDGTSHTIVECPSSTHYLSNLNHVDPPNIGFGEFSCRFVPEHQASNCEMFNCDGVVNAFVFRASDRFHYAFCIELGATKKTLLFKCPSGTSHNGVLSPTNSVDCLGNLW